MSMALTPNNQHPCCDPHHKYQKQLKLLGVKTAFVDLVLLLTGLCLFLFANKYHDLVADHSSYPVVVGVARAVGFALATAGLLGFFVSALVALALSVSYHVHNHKELHGKKDSKAKKSKK